jgi:hypothetical protein
VVDQPAAIAAEVAGVVILVIGVAAEVAARRGAGVDVANALVIGEEVDPIADPARAGEISD